MESGPSSETGGKAGKQKGMKLGSVLPKIEPFKPRKNFYDPRELGSWARNTGFVSTFSGETDRGSVSGRNPQNEPGKLDLEKGIEKKESLSPTIELDPILGRTWNRRGNEIEQDLGFGNGKDQKATDGVLGLRDGVLRGENQRNRVGFELQNVERRETYSDAGIAHANSGNGNESGTGNGHGVQAAAQVGELKKDSGDDGEEEVGIPSIPDDEEERGYGGWHQSPKLKCGMEENPGFVPQIYYGLQHFLSLAGSLVFIPLIIVPEMGGSDKDTATVISTMLLVSGISTVLNSFFGTRLPLVQGSSFVFLAPALVIMNSREYRNLSENRFKHIMRELQGAIIVGSIFQSILGFSGLMSLLLRLINPVVVAPTVAAVGLAFFSYGFPQAGTCVEISLPQIALVLLFTLYLRGVSISGNKVFRTYAVPLSVIITWAYAFFLTAGGAYNYKGCNPDIPSSNMLIAACRRHAYTMKHCRTDVSDAMRTAAWVRIPYPLQWGIPIFHMKTSVIMIFVSLVAAVDSVGTYHSAAIVTSLRPPTPSIVSRGIGMEGFCSLLAGLWGSGTGSTTLTENVHTIAVTKVANRRAVQFGALFMILFSFIGKVGAILASIPQALAAALLCFIWALMVALGLSALRYTRTSDFRNIMIVGASLFLGLSIPAYVQQYPSQSSLILPGYLIPFAAASDGPVHTGSRDVSIIFPPLSSFAVKFNALNFLPLILY
ncbi:OLC1v1011656C1 [Oldenlandia corymbosa var. corymbosa]|uniref:OLC1v1011656C1 n=1 Tax=Oldenlandia corymbosa var. corymbosa TaxID=529605 RepID=A0AAV1DU46_OLDCO|nr:OLC1v1011656C1 [Oldenlandia corymbosa var. corymbosa]